MSDNFHFDMQGVSLEKALDIAFSQHHNATAWKVDEQTVGRTRLILAWPLDMSKAQDWHILPAPMNLPAAVSFVRSWLEAADYGQEPDHDGDNGKGWRVYNEAWGHIGSDYRAFVAIEPIWEMYGK